MSKFGSKEEIIEAIAAQFSNMKHTRMNLEDLELLVEQTRELYERSLILRYKAYEAKVFGEVEEILHSNESEIDEPSIQLEQNISQEEVSQEKLPQDESFDTQTQEEEPEIQEEGEPVFDFSLFDEPVLDFNAAEKEDNSTDLENQQEQEFSSNEYLDEGDTFDKEIVAVQIEEPSFSNEDVHAVEFTSEIHTFNETPSPESSQESNLSESQNNQQTESEIDIFKNILSTNDDSIAQRLMQSKLITLIGSFGFNEKFQYIQELFNGSSDDFNQAIDVLDNLNNFEEAKQQLQFYVRLNNWDLESEITADFVKKIERRFRS